MVAPHWSKAQALLHALEASPCHDIVLYIDSDAIVREHDVTPAEFLRRERVGAACFAARSPRSPRPPRSLAPLAPSLPRSLAPLAPSLPRSLAPLAPLLPLRAREPRCGACRASWEP